MSRLSAIITCAFVSLPRIAAAEWYVGGTRTEADWPAGESQTVRIQFDEQSIEFPVRKVDLPVKALILRRDTDRADYFWLEVELPRTVDSDAYLLVINGRSIGKILTRGNKWAVGFRSLEQARRYFRYLYKFHRLDPEHAHDATKA